ncbi:XrtA/PEP-CTERM system exopolysaccharide export protein [Marinobacterium sedimentorum]|uniref:XrtA/PEP-CTERM system exopolysaccharide export protein n=1 Tax=Marinobacterium sedimentorum TaxID=2927804 RepID=UPI0020C6F35E|nr:XrtA/PEP-CTERM system exopolysaccharide export protein [Marinobacterium sedimentorum]
MKGMRPVWLACTAVIISLAFLTGCTSNPYPPLSKAVAKHPRTTDPAQYNYLIGPGDSLNIFVWGSPEVSQTVTVRPDGKVTSPLVEDVAVSGLTPTQVARKLEESLGLYIKEPIVTVIVQGFVGPYSEQVRIIGEADEPQALSYREDMTLLDVMIAVGGLTEFANGNGASVVRIVDGKQQQYGLRIDDLVEDGDISANVHILPGDIIIIPEAWF